MKIDDPLRAEAEAVARSLAGYLYLGGTETSFAALADALIAFRLKGVEEALRKLHDTIDECSDGREVWNEIDGMLEALRPPQGREQGGEG